MDRLPDLSSLSHDEKDVLIHALWAQVQALTAQATTLAARVVELEAKLDLPPKTPDNSSLSPSRVKKPFTPCETLLRGWPASHRSTRRRQRPKMRAAFRPAGPPPTITTSYAGAGGVSGAL